MLADKSMNDQCRRPVIGVPSSRMLNAAGRMHGFSTGERNVLALLEYSDCLPIQLPPIGDKCAIQQLVAMLDGLMLPGGRANVEPHHYGGPAFPDDEERTLQRVVLGTRTAAEIVPNLAELLAAARTL